MILEETLESPIDEDLSGIGPGDHHGGHLVAGAGPRGGAGVSTAADAGAAGGSGGGGAPGGGEALSQANLTQKAQVLNYHNYQLSLNPKHKQSDTIKHFVKLKQFSISRSSLNRWISNEAKIKEDALKLSSKSRSLTKVRKSAKPSMIKIQAFFDKNDAIIRCLELYYIQQLLVSPNDTPIDKEILTKFNEFKVLYDGPQGSGQGGGADGLVGGTLIDNESWPLYFKNKIIKYQIDAIQDNLVEQQQIQKHSRSLIEEKERLQKIFSQYHFDNIYEFNEISFDLDSLYSVAEMNLGAVGALDGDSSRAANDEVAAATAAVDGSLQLKREFAVTFGVIGNVSGSDFPPPLIVSNLQGNDNGEGHGVAPAAATAAGGIGGVCYDPEGNNRRHFLRDYLHKWDTKLNSEGRSVALLLDTAWEHFGLGEYRLQKFNNIKLIFINSKYDQTSSTYHRNQLRLPFSIGLERFIKYQMKIKLFNKFYKDSRIVRGRAEAFQDSVGIINNMKINYDLLIEKLQSERELNVFYRLGFEGSRLFEETLSPAAMQMHSSRGGDPSHASNVFSATDLNGYSLEATDLEHSIQQQQQQQQQQQHHHHHQGGRGHHHMGSGAEKKNYGRLTSLVRPLIPDDLKTKLQFSDTTRKLIVKQYEQELYQLIRNITKAYHKLNPSEEFDSSQVQSNLLREFTKGKKERKYNRQYSMNAIVEYVKANRAHDDALAGARAAARANSPDSFDSLKKDLEIDRRFLNDIQPFLYKAYINGRNHAQLQANSQSSTHAAGAAASAASAHPTTADGHPAVAISEETYRLFNKFYASYVNDTVVISTKHRYGDRRKKSPTPQAESAKSYKRHKSEKYIAESDKSDDEVDLAYTQLAFPSQKSVHNPLAALGSMPVGGQAQYGELGAGSTASSILESQRVRGYTAANINVSNFVSTFSDSEGE